MEEIKALVDELVAADYATPELDAELADPITGGILACAEAVWPAGVTGYVKSITWPRTNLIAAMSSPVNFSRSRRRSRS